ncbi:2-3-dihydroxybenzoic acid decarboxylase [Penicillium atrosanguineum]|uniref:2-3-dihydroxybenzoic acid decarboxylase n=1 Tax=Penicillium atrosanguineum TaxID=1132637 RepID=UPI00238A1F93|nr:2-3-dihydroxybenzoic acid decarboxylase [Penicillium atrosanguineum]KAJ5303899.1 2-3-dihydroxybenzoic acid decarboxylase [Penicillium atrosanguineum]
MATLTMTPSRQPFASLDTPRMNTLMRSKLNRQNQQNGAALSAKQSIFIDNSENIDPSSLSSSSKRKRSFDDDDISKGSPKPLKSSRLSLTQDNNVSSRLSTPLRLVPTTPRSAPLLKPAGRTPPPKSCKAFGRRSAIAKARPESSKRAVARPFSLATALSQNKPAATKPKGPASWFFDIHVDSEQEEMTNLMQHSTGVLDISDDEGKTSPADGRGKENVPPADLGIDLPRSRQATALVAAADARKASKMEEDRAPLGELAASDYYPEDCNAFSYTVVYDDESENGPFKKPHVLTQATILPPAITTSIASLLETVTPLKPVAEPTENESDAKIDIWESESATEEASQVPEDKTQSSP